MAVNSKVTRIKEFDNGNAIFWWSRYINFNIIGRIGRIYYKIYYKEQEEYYKIL